MSENVRQFSQSSLFFNSISVRAGYWSIAKTGYTIIDKIWIH
jgi:hypothetical protein